LHEAGFPAAIVLVAAFFDMSNRRPHDRHAA